MYECIPSCLPRTIRANRIVIFSRSRRNQQFDDLTLLFCGITQRNAWNTSICPLLSNISINTQVITQNRALSLARYLGLSATVSEDDFALKCFFFFLFFEIITCVFILKQLFASGSVIIGEYSPIIISPSAKYSCFVA